MLKMSLQKRMTMAALWGLIFGLVLGVIDCARITLLLHIQQGGFLKPFLRDCLSIFNTATLKFMLFSAVVSVAFIILCRILPFGRKRERREAPSLFHDLPNCALILFIVYVLLVIFYHPRFLFTSSSRIAFFVFLGLAGAAVIWLFFKMLTVFSFRGRVLAFYFIIALVVLLLAGVTAFEGYFFGFPRSGPSAQAGERQPNIMLIVLDTVRADRFSCYGHPQTVTPVMDGIAAEGMLFKRCIADSIWTLPTHASIFTGLYATTHHVGYENFFLSKDFSTIAEILNDRGYRTAGFVSNPVVSPRAQFAQGFDYYKSYSNNRKRTTAFYLLGNIIWDRAGLTERDRPKRYPPFTPFQKAEDLVTDVRDWLDFEYESGEPFYLFLNFMDAHFPYQPPEPFKSRFSALKHEWRFFTRRVKSEGYFRASYRINDTGIKMMDELYTASIAYIDYCLGGLFEYLKEEDLFDRTVLIITGDHGEYFGEHDPFYYKLYHNFGIFNQLLHVPLILRFPPAVDGGQVVEETVQNVDILPTILDLAGIDDFKPGYPLHGEDLLTLSREGGREYAFSVFTAPPVTRFMNKKQVERVLSTYEDVRLSEWFRNFSTLQNREFKLIRDADGQTALYDLNSDPRESVDLAADFPEKSAEMARALEALEKQYTDRKLEDVLVDSDPETLRHLRELGYIQ